MEEFPPTGLEWIELVRVQLLISFGDDDEMYDQR